MLDLLDLPDATPAHRQQTSYTNRATINGASPQRCDREDRRRRRDDGSVKPAYPDPAPSEATPRPRPPRPRAEAGTGADDAPAPKPSDRHLIFADYPNAGDRAC